MSRHQLNLTETVVGGCMLCLTYILFTVIVPCANVALAAPQSEENRWTLEMDCKYRCVYPTPGGSWTDNVTAKGTINILMPKGDGPVKSKGSFTHQGTGYGWTGELIFDGYKNGKLLSFQDPPGFSGGKQVYDWTELITIPIKYGAETFQDLTSFTEGVKCSGGCTWRLKGKPKLVSITVINDTATQKNVTGVKNWATVKCKAGDVIVQATTNLDTMESWKQIRWSRDSGIAVPGKPNQRKLSCTNSKVYHVKAELGGIHDELNIWVIWATVTILTTDKAPKNSPKFGKEEFDGTEKLGALSYDDGNQAAGKIAAEAKITPAGIHNVVKSGWKFRRRKKGFRCGNGVRYPRWEKWEPDDSRPEYQKLIPDSDDKIYDIDAPTIGGASKNDTNEAYINFRQWIEWNDKKCSDYAYWYWRSRWNFLKEPKVTMKDVGKGKPPIPDKCFFGP